MSRRLAAAAAGAAAVALAAACGPPAAAPAAPCTTTPIVGASACGDHATPPGEGAVGAVIARSRGAARRLGDSLCTGTLVAADTVLTAGHCVVGDRDIFFTLAPTLWGAAGRAQLPPDCRRVVRVTRPADPDTPGPPPDLALAFLEAPVPAVRPLPLAPPAAPGAGPIAGEVVWLAGFGVRTAPDVHPWADDDGELVWATSRIDAASPGELRIGGPGRAQRCRGDSGGPTLGRAVDGTWRVIGVGSRRAAGRECIDGGIDTRVDAHHAWLMRAMAAR